MLPNTTSTSPFIRVIHLVKDYFINSDEKLIAWTLLIGAILSVIALVALGVVFSWWSVGFWAALAAKDLTLFLFNMGIFSLTVSAFVGINVLKNYLIDALSIRWRNWLTQKLITQYLESENNYLDIARLSSQIENPGQRIQEDIKTFVNLTLSLICGFIQSTLSLVTFIGTLWVVGGALSFVLLGFNIVIPGYLVWMALFLSIGATLITYVLGKSLTHVNQKEEELEADFRKDLELLSNESENIAHEHGESYHKKILNKDIQAISDNSYEKLSVNTKLISFQSFYTQLTGILPYLLAAPLFFSGAIELGQLMQVGYAFSEVNTSFSWFVNTYDTIAKYKVSINRLIELQEVFEAGQINATQKNIVIKNNHNNQLEIKSLQIAYPSSTDFMMRKLNFSFSPGVNTLIKGPSGLGKSTLFKVLSGSWKYGEGEVHIPQKSTIYFLPQKPILPTDTLKAVLAYPDPVETYTDEQYIQVLTMVGGMNQFISELNQNSAWSKRLSAGQQQRISFARVLLKKPDWLFLDEATASLDPDSEQQVYGLIKKELVHTTFISIAHRPSLDKFHDQIIKLKVNNSGEIQVSPTADEPFEHTINDSILAMDSPPMNVL